MSNYECVIREFTVQSNEMTKRLLLSILNSNLSEVLNFFLIFSRFEYALKRCSRYLGGNKNNPKADWETFGKDVAKKFNEHACQELEYAKQYLRENPPKKLCKNSEGQLDWCIPKENLTEIQLLINAVKRIRNNLFHGDKRISSPEDPSRNYELMKHSITVLKYLLYSSDEVRSHYCEPLK